MEIHADIFPGRPESDTGRQEREMRCYDLLDKLGIEYIRADHLHADTIEQCLSIEKQLGADICKNLFLCNRQKTEFYLLLTEGEKPFKTKVFSALIGSSRLSFAPPEEMEKLLDITPGSVSILGLMNDREKKINLYVDRPVAEKEYIGCHPCMNTSTLKIKTADILGKFLDCTGHKCTVVDIPEEKEE